MRWRGGWKRVHESNPSNLIPESGIGNERNNQVCGCQSRGLFRMRTKARARVLIDYIDRLYLPWFYNPQLVHTFIMRLNIVLSFFIPLVSNIKPSFFPVISVLFIYDFAANTGRLIYLLYKLKYNFSCAICILNRLNRNRKYAIDWTTCPKQKFISISCIIIICFGISCI